MYRVKTYVDKSTIHGLGVYAGEDIPKDTIVWEAVPGFDQTFTQAQYEAFPKQARDYLDVYAWWDEQGIHLCGDDGIYCNHSEAPNVGNWPPGANETKFEIALRDIKKGEEIVSDYRTFDQSSRDDLDTALRIEKSAVAA